MRWPLVTVLLLLLAWPVLGADITWRPVGPGGGGWIEAIACDPRDPDTIYLGCDVGGFYVSRDAGRTWSTRNQGLNDRFVECIAVQPGDSGVLLLGMEGGVFRSADRGATWRWQRAGFPEPQRYGFSAPIGALCFDPTRPDTAYAGIGRPRWGRDGRGHIYSSTDAGETWKLITPDGALDPEAIVCDLEVSSDGAYVLAATNRGIYRSDDEGATWQPSGAGLEHNDIRELAIAPSDPLVVYCTLRTTARDDEAWNGGVYRSDDGGRTWVPRSEGLDQRVARAGEPAELGSEYKEIAVDPGDPEVVYVGSDSWVSAGVFGSADGGRTWSRRSRHFGDDRNMDYGWITQWGPSVTCLALSPARPDRIVFGTSGHVFLTDDRGQTWEQRYCRTLPDERFVGNGLEVTCLNDVVFDPARPERLYFCYFDIGLLISDDAGTTFRRSSQGMRDDGNCFTVLCDPQDPQKLWAATGQWGWNQGCVCRSTDGGATWQVTGEAATGLPNGQTRCLLLDPGSPVGQRVLYATVNGHGVYRSADDGLSWQAINTGLPEAARQAPCGLVMDPGDPAHLRLALGTNPPSGSGVYESRDAGANWSRVSGEVPFADLKDFLGDPRDPEVLYVCQREMYDRKLDPPRLFPGGVFKSTDGGRTWAHILDFPFVNCLTVSPLDSSVIYAGSTDHPYHDASQAEGLYKSTDGGRTWQQENDGLANQNISCVAISPHDPSVLVVGTGGNGGYIGVDESLAGRR
mgnify:CR=1 FL=1